MGFMIVGFCLGAFYFLLVVIIRLKFPFQYLFKQSKECVGMWFISWVSQLCSSLLGVLGFMWTSQTDFGGFVCTFGSFGLFLFVCFLIRLMSLLLLKVLISSSILLPERLAFYSLLLSSVLFCFVQPSECSATNCYHSVRWTARKS